jgi:hypothetical protein
MSSSNLVSLRYKKETTYGTKVDAVKASLVIEDLTYEAVKGGEPGNLIQVEYLDTGTAGAEVVTVTGTLISVSMEDGASTANQIRTAVLADTDAAALVNVTVTGTGTDVQSAHAAAPLAGGLNQFKQARFTSEKYSGTPETTESQQIRTDRMSSGQVVTGLKVDGGHNFELAIEEAIEDFLESAMFNAWESFSPVTDTFTLNATTKTLSRAAGSFVTEGVEVGQVLLLSNFAASGNNIPVMVKTVSALSLTFASASGLTTATESATYQIADRLKVGTTKKSITIEKCFTDLTTKAIVYKGALVSQMELNVQYGSLISGSFSTQANSYDTADAASEFASYNEYIADAATTNTLNGSVDMPFIMSSMSGSFVQDEMCIQSLKIQLQNNLTAQTCIGRAAPENYNPGTAQVTVDISSYLKDANWPLLALKLSQSPFGVGFLVKNTDGWYGFFMPAVQVSFDDPASGGQNQDISMEMKGTAKVGSNGESSLYIFRIPA